MTENKKEQQYHYFASTVFNWVTADTRKEAIEKVARAGGRDTKRIITNQGSMYAWSCKVPLPQSAHYEIRFYSPHDVGVTDGMETAIIKMTEKEIRYISTHERFIHEDAMGDKS